MIKTQQLLVKILLLKTNNINYGAQVEIYEIKKAVEEITFKYKKLHEKVNVDELKIELEQYKVLTLNSSFWDDPKKAAKTNKQIQALETTIKTINGIYDNIEEFNMALELFELDEISLEDINEEFDALNDKFKEFEITVLLSGEYDDCDALVEVHPGAGGTESQDWASMIYDMYSKYFKKVNYKVEVIDYQTADVAGIKNVLVRVSGTKAYGKMHGEQGVHRLVRISPFDSAKKRHTSFCSVKVMPYIEEDDAVEINDSDLRIDVYRSGGAGGQSVNTTDSAVRITHIPTNTIVTCQNERSQIQNKEQAMKVLRSRLVELKLQQQAEERAKLQGEVLSNGWGSQKRSYVLHPYKMVKDHNSNFESSQAEKVLSGDIEGFLYHNLLK